MVERLLRRDPSAHLTPARIETMLQVLNRQIARLGHLVDELLDVSRLHTGGLTLACEPVELCSLTRDVVGRMAPQLAAAGCRTELELDEPVVGRWDRSRLEQVLVNLLSKRDEVRHASAHSRARAPPPAAGVNRCRRDRC